MHSFSSILDAITACTPKLNRKQRRFAARMEQMEDRQLMASGAISSVLLGAQSFTPTFGTTGAATYAITVNRGSGGGNEFINLTASGLDANGISYAWSGGAQNGSKYQLHLNNGNNQATATLTVFNSTSTNAGNSPFTVTATNDGDSTDHGNGNSAFAVNKANAAIVLNGYNLIYDGNAHFATGTSTGVGGANLNAGLAFGTSHTNVGAFDDTWTFHDNSGNYNDNSGNVHNVIQKANITATPASVSNLVYNGLAQATAAVSFKGVKGESLGSQGASHTNAGSYTDNWAYTDATGNYNNANGQVTSFIAKANATVGATAPTGLVYTGDDQITGQVALVGVKGEGLFQQIFHHTNAGNFSDAWAFHDASGNYNDANDSVGGSIAQANITATPAVAPGLVYNGLAQATGQVTLTGVKGEALGLFNFQHTNAGDYADDWTYTDTTGNYHSTKGSLISALAPGHIAKANITATSTAAPGLVYTGDDQTTGQIAVVGVRGEGLFQQAFHHTNAGSFTDGWAYNDTTGNYNNGSGNIVSAIARADGVITPATIQNLIYNGLDQTTGQVTVVGVKGEGLFQQIFHHTNAGDFSDAWTFHDTTGNYNDAGNSVGGSIGKANITATPSSISGLVYNGDNQVTGQVVITGVRGETLIGLMPFQHTDAGDYTDSWVYNDTTGNYNNGNGHAYGHIAKADVTVTPSAFSDLVYNGLDQNTGQVAIIGVKGEGLFQQIFHHINAGDYTDGWVFTDTTGNYNGASGHANGSIAKANITATLAAIDGLVYNGDNQTTGQVAITGVRGETLIDLITFQHQNAGDFTDNWFFNDTTGNYNNGNGKAIGHIAKANAIITPSAFAGLVYNGLDQNTGQVAITGVKGEGLFQQIFHHTDAGDYTDGWVYNDATGNYNNSNGNAYGHIAKANATITPSAFSGLVYTGDAQTTGQIAVIGVRGETLLLQGFQHTDAGDYTDGWVFTDTTGNYNNGNGNAYGHIAKADFTITPSVLAGLVYNGDDQSTASVVLTGVKGEGLFQQIFHHTNAGDFTDGWVFTDTTGNYKNGNGNIISSIAKADITVTPSVLAGLVYNGFDQNTGQVTVTGVKGEGLFQQIFHHINAGDFTDVWSFIDHTGNYKNGNGNAYGHIAKANITATLAAIDGLVYNGDNQTTGQVAITGVRGETLIGPFVFQHQNAGDFTDNWVYTDTTGNYNNGNGHAYGHIAKANITVTPTVVDGLVYNGDAQTTATVVLTGVKGEHLGQHGYQHINAGTFTDTWTRVDDTGNYNDANGSVVSTISKANITATQSVNQGLVYNGSSQATGQVVVTGVKGEQLGQFSFQHTDAGLYTDDWTYVDHTGNYHSVKGSGIGATVTSYIAKADVTVTPTVAQGLVYNGSAQTTGQVSITGVQGETLFQQDFQHQNAGGYTDAWTYTDSTGNYNDANGAVNGAIAKADGTVVSVATPSLAYNGSDQVTATVTVTGVQGETLFQQDFQHQNAGSYTDSWTYTDTTGNYNDASGSVDSSIARFGITVTPTVSTGLVYNGSNQTTAVVTITGVNGETLLQQSFQHQNAGSFTDRWTYTDATGNYSDASDTVGGFIARADITATTTSPVGLVYNGSAQTTATVAITGVQGEALFQQSFQHTSAGAFTDTWTYTDATGNYNDASSTLSNSIARADVTVTPTVFSGLVYTGSDQTTGQVAVTGVQGEALFQQGFQHQNAGSYSDSWVFTDTTGNYNDASGAVGGSIAKANVTITPVSVQGLVYSGASQSTGQVNVTGVQGEALFQQGFQHTNAGGYSDSWAFADTTGNYNDANGIVNGAIAKANVTITPVSVPGLVYSGSAQTTGQVTVTGVQGETLLQQGFQHQNAGGYSDSWVFTDSTGNYNDASGAVGGSIAKANAAIGVTPFSLVYDGQAHWSTGAALGVHGEVLVGLNLAATVHADAGVYNDTWFFTDSTGNYNNASGVVGNYIAQAQLTIVANPASMVQGTALPALSATYYGFVAGQSAANLSSQPVLFTNANGAVPGTYSVFATGASSPNYHINYVNNTMVVTPAPVQVVSVSVQWVNIPVKTIKTKHGLVTQYKRVQVIQLRANGALNPSSALNVRDYALSTIPANKRQKSKPVALSQVQQPAANVVNLFTRNKLVLNPAVRVNYNLLGSYGQPVNGSAVLHR